jgi:hypothetical protein
MRLPEGETGAFWMMPVALWDLQPTMSPTARSLKPLRRLGFLTSVVERWVPGAATARNLVRKAIGMARPTPSVRV